MTRSATRADQADEAAAVAFRIAEFIVRTETERLALFRLHLRATVVRASPLLADLARIEGIDLDVATRFVLPPWDWPCRPLTAHSGAHQRGSIRRGRLGTPSSVLLRRAFVDPGLVIRDADHPRGLFAIRPSGAVLGFTAGIGRCLVSAFGPTATLKLAAPLPDTIVLALPGRRMGDLVDHPLFTERAYTVLRVAPDLADGLPVISFRAPLVPFTMPSARALGSEPA